MPSSPSPILSGPAGSSVGKAEDLQSRRSATDEVVEWFPGVFGLAGAFEPATLRVVCSMGITHVINLQAPGEYDCRGKEEGLRILGVSYQTYVTHPAPSSEGLASFIRFLAGLPANARVLVHCAPGSDAEGLALAFRSWKPGPDPEGTLHWGFRPAAPASS